MPATWISGTPHRILLQGSAWRAPETAMRSQTDSGKQRQRRVFTATDPVVAGVIPMPKDKVLAFLAWRDGLGGATFTFPKHPFTGTACEARFVAGEQGQPTPDPRSPRWLVPVVIEFVAPPAEPEEP